MNLLIKNARIVDYSQDFIGDIYIENGNIKEVGLDINIDAINVIDAKGLTLMPSFIDTHAHFREPGLTYKEDIETGSKAALRGGYTGVCLMANTKPICSSKEVLEEVRNREKELNLIDLHQCISVTKGFNGKDITHLDNFANDNRLKAISDDGVGVMDSEIMYKAMLKAKEHGWVIMSHAEDHSFSDIDMRIAENIMTLRDIYLAKETGARLHMCHVSTKEAIGYIKNAKKRFSNITCEVTPHHISLTKDINNYRVNPPIREKEDVYEIINAIKDGIIDCIGTDHAPHTQEDKEKGSPGMVGLETSFSICYTSLVKSGAINLNKLSEIMSKNCADILGMNKGRISPGVEGDVVLLDLDKKIKVNSEEFNSKGKNTPFQGMEFYGEVQMTIKAGRILYKK
ncbi:dihydroorotase [Clostridium tertium]|jgi:dihydroorotase|uniref:dihydroorotase n=1 Tax=Clostridium TaxID=1485 RepID=UPI00019AFC26|nr:MULTISPECIES: dihydroorotase [Clostridium]EEH97456.1 dihydroorotase, multifunctional complex type [Clostridium sp. 7_2_43FAA]MBU6134953.1 dihydroorotase [Clostridium tertium]MDB1941916.1 dihydroorotase [Clostridium tertium]MDB1948660.1 dihydroorotase [Clostridium tertium]MDB1955871.1 dihydroorotase [Clostridium tertium]